MHLFRVFKAFRTATANLNAVDKVTKDKLHEIVQWLVYARNETSYSQ